MVRFGWFVSYNNIENVHFLRKNWTSETEKDRLRHNYLISSVYTLANNSIDQWKIALLFNYWIWYQSAHKGGNEINLVIFFGSLITFLFEQLVWVILFARRFLPLIIQCNLLSFFWQGEEGDSGTLGEDGSPVNTDIF